MIDKIDAEFREAYKLDPYRSVGELWVCLVKYANLLPTTGEEHEQVCSLVRKLDRNTARALLVDESVNCLCTLDPPLETVQAHQRERLSPKAGLELERLRDRDRDPKAALMALVEILQRIRDKKAHAFKSPDELRDVVILKAAAFLLHGLCNASSNYLRESKA